MRKVACIVKVMNTPSPEAVEAFHKKFYEIVVKAQIKQPGKQAA